MTKQCKALHLRTFERNWRVDFGGVVDIRLQQAPALGGVKKPRVVEHADGLDPTPPNKKQAILVRAVGAIPDDHPCAMPDPGRRILSGGCRMLCPRIGFHVV